jgi:hypothetical protein
MAVRMTQGGLVVFCGCGDPNQRPAGSSAKPPRPSRTDVRPMPSLVNFDRDRIETRLAVPGRHLRFESGCIKVTKSKPLDLRSISDRVDGDCYVKRRVVRTQPPRVSQNERVSRCDAAKQAPPREEYRDFRCDALEFAWKILNGGQQKDRVGKSASRGFAIDLGGEPDQRIRARVYADVEPAGIPPRRFIDEGAVAGSDIDPDSSVIGFDQPLKLVSIELVRASAPNQFEHLVSFPGSEFTSNPRQPATHPESPKTHHSPSPDSQHGHWIDTRCPLGRQIARNEGNGDHCD